MVDKKRRRLFRQGSCFCWQSCTKLFQSVWWCQGLCSFRLGLAFPLHVPTMTAGVEGEGGWSVWEPAGGLFSPHSSLVLLQAGSAWEERSPWRAEAWTRGPRPCAQTMCPSPLSLPTSHANGYKNLPFTPKQLQEGSWKWGLWVCWTGR